MKKDIILKVDNLKQHFITGVGRYKIYNKAVDGISFDVRKGEVFSLVGESGCGKTTTGRTIMKIYKPTDGTVHLLGHRIVAGTRDLTLELKSLGKNLKKKKIETLKNKKLSEDEKKAIIKELYTYKRNRRKEIKAEIKARNKDQKSRFGPSREKLNVVKEESLLKIKEYRNLIAEENAEFLKFKKTAFAKTDALPSNFSKTERDKIHSKELAKYREVRKLRDQKVKEYEHEI